MHDVSAVGLLLYLIVNTFMGFDWLMSLDPHWFSSLYGAIFVAGEALAGMTFIILVANWLRQREPMDAIFGRKLFHDYGKLLFAYVMFWTYLTISQFIIMWQGNLPEEAVCFQVRFHGGWGYVAAGLLIFHFFFPVPDPPVAQRQGEGPDALGRGGLRARDALGRPRLADPSDPPRGRLLDPLALRRHPGRHRRSLVLSVRARARQSARSSR